MIRQTVLPFKLKRTEERITARSGLALFVEFMQAMKVGSRIDRHFPCPRSGRGFPASAYVMPLTLMLYGGGDAIDDVREIRDDQTLREVIGLQTVPTSAAIGDWLRRMGERDGIACMERVNDLYGRPSRKTHGPGTRSSSIRRSSRRRSAMPA